MKQSEIEVGAYYSPAKSGYWSMLGFVKLVTEITATKRVRYTLCEKNGRSLSSGHNECSLAAFARWAGARTEPEAGAPNKPQAAVIVDRVQIRLKEPRP